MADLNAVPSVIYVLAGIAGTAGALWKVYSAVRSVVEDEVAAVRKQLEEVTARMPDAVKLSLMNGGGAVVRTITHEVMTAAIMAHEAREAVIAKALEEKVEAAMTARRRTRQRRTK